mmetsp:Transcript_30342/g.80399  ORF Transcript_30342/g.80399 Transcript_30342/m.80399 type:complete len:108 (-) Transcript_30342:420-743(-)
MRLRRGSGKRYKRQLDSHFRSAPIPVLKLCFKCGANCFKRMNLTPEKRPSPTHVILSKPLSPPAATGQQLPHRFLHMQECYGGTHWNPEIFVQSASSINVCRLGDIP